MTTDDERKLRWRLVLGEDADAALGCSLSGQSLARDGALSWLYGQDAFVEEGAADRMGGAGPSQLTIPDWINAVQELFPRDAIERMEKEAVEECGLHEVVTNPEVLARVEPSETLLRAILLTKHLMNEEVLGMARALVAKVVARLIAALASEVRRALHGSKSHRIVRRGHARSFHARATIQRNLKHYDQENKRLLLETPCFFERTARRGLRWQLILLVDQSGSMASSVIHSAVTAACLWGLPSLKTHLVAFDTSVVDLTSSVEDPVELLMRVQLGGGTDIANAVRYGESLIENPQRTIFAVVSDFYEGGSEADLVRSVRRITSQGVRFMALCALDDQSQPFYDKLLARKLVNAGASAGAMTPKELVDFVAETIR